MHKDDQMTPKERMAAFFSGKDVDRIPILPFITAVSGSVIGMSHREKRSSAKNLFLCQSACYERFGHDSISVEYGLHGIGTAMGSTTNNPENNVPAIKEHYLTDLNHLNEKLDLAKIERKNDSWAQCNYEMAQMLIDKYGNEVGVSLSTPGPMTAASSLYPIAKLLRATRKEPEKVHELLRFCTNAIKLLAKEFMDGGVGISLCDPVASGTIMNEKSYREYVLPYTKEIIQFIHDYGKSVTYHICGNTTALTEAMVESGCNILSIDNAVSLEDTKKRVGDKIVLMGNVDPINTMMLGTTKDVEKAVKECFRQGWDNPKGYLISTGCGIPIDSPVENIDAFMAASRKYGKWPLNPEAFM
ncbi:Methylcobalamin:coenzyme M methyltransferase, methanol-specific [Lachnospiraceae bacterium TWA4]|nr:Methylcobalamin:coenzyme M methyltransferase, methanol-specific [Lachnospiraceae bacterium TWA4]